MASVIGQQRSHSLHHTRPARPTGPERQPAAIRQGYKIDRISIDDMIRITETRSNHGNRRAQKRFERRIQELNALKKYGFNIDQIYGSHNNPAARKQGISQFDTLVVYKGSEYYALKLGSSFYCDETHIMDCLIATNKLSNSQDLADYGISFASTQQTYETNATTLLHLFHGATINHPNQFCTIRVF